MIDYIRGTVQKKNIDHIVIEVHGMGYDVSIPSSTLTALPACGTETRLYIWESSSMYGSGTTWYGFATEDERALFDMIRGVGNISSKVALDLVSKVNTSLPEFRRAITEKDVKTLTSYFGITKKTAEKLILGLKDKVGEIGSSAGLLATPVVSDGSQATTVAGDAIEALIALGYKENIARNAVHAVVKQDPSFSVENIITTALRVINA